MKDFDHFEEPPIISVKEVGVTYQRKGLFHSRSFDALKSVTFDLYKGESLAVLGRNGAGKSTLLQLLAGVLRPDRGQLINRGVQAQLLTLQLGFDAKLTGRDNAILSGILLGLRRSDIESRLKQIFEFAELESFMNVPLSTYSSGMRARLGFAVSVYLEPDVLLIDEVFAVGDAAFQAKSKQVMEDKIASNKTIVLVSHNVELIKKYCNRAVWIDQGVSKMEGSITEVCRAYSNSASIDHQKHA
ncbi:MAG: ABC transporter ATP-binding protein [Gammaproteobacteria bacterium]|nr:ABC transporter ATP-binding protein [Gammaproteobacteria bacterium]